MIIYITINLINNKIYVGQDSNHNPKYFGSGIIVMKAIKKYGKHNFVKFILENINDIKTTGEREEYWIKYFDARNPKIGYNIAHGGNTPMLGMHPSQEIRKKQSEAQKGRKQSKETIEKIREGNKGQKRSLEVKEKMKHYKHMLGKKHSEETIEKMRNAQIGKKKPIICGIKNGMYKKSIKDIWIKKYGEKKANEMWKQRYSKK